MRRELYQLPPHILAVRRDERRLRRRDSAACGAVRAQEHFVQLLLVELVLRDEKGSRNVLIHSADAPTLRMRAFGLNALLVDIGSILGVDKPCLEHRRAPERDPRNLVVRPKEREGGNVGREVEPTYHHIA